MPDYRRHFLRGGTYFFTLVTHKRFPLFDDERARTLLGNVTRDCFKKYPVDVVATVLLPEHLHAIWTLPAGDDRYSLRWTWIKRKFTHEWLAMGGGENAVGPTTRIQRRRGIWQRRFWEHTIRDEADLEAHFDYIHYNPVKHGLVDRPADWRWSSFHRYVEQGIYPPTWADAAADLLPFGSGE